MTRRQEQKKIARCHSPLLRIAGKPVEDQGKLYGMKSHDRNELILTTLNVEKLTIMKGNILALLCKLTQLLSSSFFDLIVHLLIHLPYEARVGGLVQYHWMYSFERFLHSLKNKVKNKARVEASICEAYLVEETSTFASFYYLDKIETRRTRIPRNVDSGEGSSSTPPISTSNYPGRPCGKVISYFLDQIDLEVAHLYVLLNCEHVESYLHIYTEFLRELNPTASDAEIDSDISSTFPTWFKQYVLNSENNIQDSLLVNLAWGPKRKVESWPMYIINGYKFHTIV
ncbi:hypothetical protein CR513_28998, partial [Mucuna pruriens]